MLPLCVGVLAILLPSAWLGSWFRRRSWVVRAWLIGVILIAPFGAGLLWLTIWQRHGFGYTYLHPVLAPAAVLAAAFVAIPFELASRHRHAVRWIPTVAACAGFAWLTFLAARTPRATNPGDWTLADATAIADQARKMGLSYDQLVFRVQSPACRELLVGMSVEAPPPAAPAPAKGRAQLQVLRARRAALATLPDGTAVVSLDSGEVAIVRAVDSWLQPEALVACHVPVGSGAAVCVPARGGSSEPGSLDRFRFAARSFPEVHHMELPPPYVATYEIPLSPGAGERREIMLADRDGGCGWSITRAEGVRVEGQLPARHVRLFSESGAPGLLVLEKPACAADPFDSKYPPCVFEIPPDDPLHALVERR